VSDIFSPVSGEISAINDVLAKSPERLNEDPHGDAWLIKVKLADPGELNELLSAPDYQTYIGAE
jgi:glycine cleavage system H protein